MHNPKLFTRGGHEIFFFFSYISWVSAVLMIIDARFVRCSVAQQYIYSTCNERTAVINYKKALYCFFFNWMTKWREIFECLIWLDEIMAPNSNITFWLGKNRTPNSDYPKCETFPFFRGKYCKKWNQSFEGQKLLLTFFPLNLCFLNFQPHKKCEKHSRFSHHKWHWWRVDIPWTPLLVLPTAFHHCFRPSSLVITISNLCQKMS